MVGFIRGALVIIGLVVTLAAAAYFVLRRGDITYETLAVRYGTPASRYVDLPSGVRMHYRDEGNPDGPVIILVHGFSSSLQTWEPWVERFGTEYRVISLDLPGHGLTRGPAGYAASIPAFRDEVGALAAELELTRFAIGGNSMGGHVAWEYALAHPAQIDALILIDSGGWAAHSSGSDTEPLVFKLLRNPITRPVLRDLDNTALIRQGLEASFGDASLATDEMVQRYADFSRAPGHRDILLQISTGPRDPATPERLAPLANLPVLILHGDTDRVIPISSSERFRDAISGSEFVPFVGIGHLPQEEAADASAQAVREFLYRVHEGPALATAAQ